MNIGRNGLYLIIAVLAVGAAVLGYREYQHRQGATGVEIKIGEGTLSIEKK
jgi:hypothetical protein